MLPPDGLQAGVEDYFCRKEMCCADISHILVASGLLAAFATPYLLELQGGAFPECPDALATSNTKVGVLPAAFCTSSYTTDAVTAAMSMSARYLCLRVHYICGYIFKVCIYIYMFIDKVTF